MPTITCVGNDNVSRNFNYTPSYDLLNGKTAFNVTSIPPAPGGGFFELCVQDQDADTVRVVMIHHHNLPEYIGKGIPDVLLCAVKSLLGKDVQSSRTQGTGADEYRTPEATRMWNRLVKKCIATYDEVADVYRLM